MKGYLAIADLHGKKTTPRYRKDDYKKSFLSKLEWVVQYANKNDLRILIAGDIFDSVREGLEVLNMVLDVVLTATYKPLAVYGQHDLQFHTKNMVETPIYNLALAGAIHMLGATPFKDGDTEIFGCNFGDEVPLKTVGNRTNILVAHVCITPTEPPFFLPDAISAKKFVEDHKRYDFIVSGDYHESYSVRHGTTELINCGPLMRNSKSLIDHKPCAWEIIGDSVKQVFIPVSPPEKVFDIQAIEFDESHGLTINLDRMKEIMGKEYAIAKFEDVVWAGFSVMKQHKDCVLRKESVQKALRGEPIWKVQ